MTRRGQGTAHGGILVKNPDGPRTRAAPRPAVRDYRRAERPAGEAPGASPTGPVELCIPGKPVSTNQTYRVARGGMFKSKDAQAWQERITQAARMAMHGREPLAGPVDVLVTFYFDSERPDTDGPVKGLLDRLAPHVYRNDRQVARYSVTRRIDREAPRTLVTVRPWAEVELVMDRDAVAAMFEAASEGL